METINRNLDKMYSVLNASWARAISYFLNPVTCSPSPSWQTIHSLLNGLSDLGIWQLLADATTWDYIEGRRCPLEMISASHSYWRCVVWFNNITGRNSWSRHLPHPPCASSLVLHAGMPPCLGPPESHACASALWMQALLWDVGSDLFSSACLSPRPLAGTCWPNPHSFLHPDPSFLDLLAGCVLHTLPPTFGFSVLGLGCLSWLGADRDDILNSLRVFWPQSWWDHLSPF